MGLALAIALIVGGIFFFLWQEEHEKLVKAEKHIKDLQRKLKTSQKQSKSTPSSSGFATIEKSEQKREYIIKKPEPIIIIKLNIFIAFPIDILNHLDII